MKKMKAVMIENCSNTIGFYTYTLLTYIILVMYNVTYNVTVCAVPITYIEKSAVDMTRRAR